MDAPEPKLGNNLIRSNGGYELVLAALLLGFLGWWLDSRFGTRPFLMLGLGIVGFVAAGFSVYYRFKSSLERLQAEADELKSAALKAGALRTETRKAALDG